MKLDFINNFVIRTPLYNQEILYDLFKHDKIDKEILISFLNDIQFVDALFLASPELLKELIKWKKGIIKDKKKEKKLRISLFKYITRICTRSTPFGVFSSVGTGDIVDNKESGIFITGHKRHNRINLEVLSQIIHKIEGNVIYKDYIKYFPNSSIIKIGDKYRYYERKGEGIEVNEINFNDVLKQILKLSIIGLKRKELVEKIINKFNTYDSSSIINYIDELIDNQILISQLSFNIEIDPLEMIITFFVDNNLQDNFYYLIEKIKYLLKRIKIGHDNINIYNDLYGCLNAMNINYERKNLIFTDTYTKFDSSYIDRETIENIKSILELFNNRNIKFDYNLKYLVDNIIDVYGDKEVELYKIFTNEYNLIYQYYNRLNPLLDNINIHKRIEKKEKETLKEVNINLFRKINCSNQSVIVLNENDFNKTDFEQGKIVDTFSLFIENVLDDNKEKTVLSFTGGSSALNILSRFSFDDNIYAIIKKISDYEVEKNQNFICADFNHLPKVLSNAYLIFRKPIKKYNIQFLNNGIDEYSIPIQDIYLKIIDNKIQLYSKKFNKFIIPYISNTQNTDMYNILPIYKFFADLKKDKKYGMGFFIDDILNVNKYIPRIEIQNLIIFKETWLLLKKDIDILLTISSKDLRKNQNLLNFLKQKKLHDIVVLVEGDNRFVFSFFNELSFECFKDLIKGKERAILNENFSNSKVKSKMGSYKNEIIIPFLT